MQQPPPFWALLLQSDYVMPCPLQWTLPLPKQLPPAPAGPHSLCTTQQGLTNVLRCWYFPTQITNYSCCCQGKFGFSATLTLPYTDWTAGHPAEVPVGTLLLVPEVLCTAIPISTPSNWFPICNTSQPLVFCSRMMLLWPASPPGLPGAFLMLPALSPLLLLPCRIN